MKPQFVMNGNCVDYYYGSDPPEGTAIYKDGSAGGNASDLTWESLLEAREYWEQHQPKRPKLPAGCKWKDDETVRLPSYDLVDLGGVKPNTTQWSGREVNIIVACVLAIRELERIRKESAK